MPDGILKIIAVGQANVILNGNPKKTFWKTSYSKYTNFGMQRFRLDFNGTRKFRLNEKSKFTFKYPRYGDLVMDSYLSISLPHIWSPLLPIQDSSSNTYYIPYNFKWIENLGLAMIDEIEVTAGGQILQKYSGDYLISMMQRDFSTGKKHLIDKMTGNSAYFNNPQYDATNILQKYPNAVYNTSSGGAEPSIRGKQLLIPLNLWFGMTSKQAFPLVSLQYNELEIHVTLKPIRELCLIRDVLNPYNNYAYKAPNFNEPSDQFYHFLQTPPGVNNSSPTTSDDFYNSYTDKRNEWNADVHLITTYAFLSDDERRVFASQPQEYLIKEIYETDYHNIVNSAKLKIDSFGMIASWMWFARRNDAFLRNQWTNYTNWEYSKNPNIIRVPTNNSSSTDTDFTPFINQDIELPDSPYIDTNFNDLLEGIYDTSSTVLSLPGFYPPTMDIICDNDKIYTDSAAITNDNGQALIPIWSEQGSINTSFSSDNPYETLFPLAWGSNNILPSPFSTSGVYLTENEYRIISTVGILLDGKYRENTMNSSIYEYIEQYTKSDGGTNEYVLDGLQCYNYCLNTSPFDLQPSGAMNMSRFSTIELEITTIEPPRDTLAQYATICNEEMQPDGTTLSINIGVNKPSWSIYKYTYDIHLMEERYNIIKFTGGNVGLMFAR